MRLDHSLRSNLFDAFSIRKLRQIDVSNFAPTFSTGQVYEQLFQPLEEYNCSDFGGLYSRTLSPIELTTRNSTFENLAALRRALRHKLPYRLILNGAVRRTRVTTSYVERRQGSRPNAAPPATGMTSAFRNDGAYALRIGRRDCWVVCLKLARALPSTVTASGLARPANYATPTARRPTRLKGRATAVGSRTRE